MYCIAFFVILALARSYLLLSVIVLRRSVYFDYSAYDFTLYGVMQCLVWERSHIANQR